MRAGTRGAANRCASRDLIGACGLVAARALGPSMRRKPTRKPTLQREERSEHPAVIAFPPSELPAASFFSCLLERQRREDYSRCSSFLVFVLPQAEATATVMPASVKTEICAGNGLRHLLRVPDPSVDQ